MSLEKMYLEMTDELKKKSVMFNGSFSFEGDNKIVIKCGIFPELTFVILEEDNFYTFMTVINAANAVSIIRFNHIELSIHYDVNNTLIGLDLMDESGKGIAAISF